MALIKAQDMDLKTFFTTNTYLIPEYQRSYAWTKTELEDLWDDIKQLVDSTNELDHFLGQIVIHSENIKSSKKEKNFIIDGQQRITSMIIFASALRSNYLDLLQKIKKSSLDNKDELEKDINQSVSDINLTYTGSKTKRNDTIKLRLGKLGNDFFQKNIIDYDEPNLDEVNESRKKLKSEKNEEDVTRKPNDSEKKINQAFKYFKSCIKNSLTDDLDDNLNTLDDLLNAIDKKILISHIKTDDQTQAFIIFETLNARGMNLATSDLLKNHIIRTANEESRRNIIDKWDDMVTSLEYIDPTKFIRSFWNSREDFTRDKNLYKKLRNKYNNTSKVTKLMEELKEFTPLYKSLVNPDTYAHTDHTINNLLLDLKQIKLVPFIR